jgi:hypothetical protein
MNCAEYQELFVEYLEGLLEGAEKQAVEEHLHACETCRTELQELQNLQQRLARNGAALAGTNLEDAVMNRIVREQSARLKSARQAGAGLRLRRLIMKSTIAKVAVAAVVVVVGVGALTLWTGTKGVVLADVLTQVQQITAYMYQMTMTIGGKGPTGIPMNQNIQASVLIARDFGMKNTMDMTDPNGGKTMRQEQYILPQEGAMFMVMPNEKKYIRMELNDTLLEKIREQNYDPGTMLARVIDCRYQSLGRSVIGGVEVEGFQTTDPNYLAGMGGQVNVTVWVDVRTRLPVRMEMDMTVDQMQIHGVTDDFRWNVAARAADFQPVIPDDYTTLPGGPTKMPAMDEQGAIAGLKLFADLTGRYPEKLDLMSLMTELGKRRDGALPPIARQMAEGTKGLSEDERTKKMIDIMMPIQGAGMFYLLLTQEKKEPVYYGNVVTPGDITQVLLRWKTGENEYRVIFADLHAATVTAEQLAQLEAALPQ